MSFGACFKHYEIVSPSVIQDESDYSAIPVDAVNNDDITINYDGIPYFSDYSFGKAVFANPYGQFGVVDNKGKCLGCNSADTSTTDYELWGFEKAKVGEVAYVRYNNKYYAIGDHAEFNNSDLPDNQKIYNMASGDFQIWEITSDENRDIVMPDM